MRDVTETTSRGARDGSRTLLGRQHRWHDAPSITAGALAAALLLAACGGGGGTAEQEPDVNAVEALMALDDVRVAGVTLGPAAPGGVSPPAPGVAAAEAPVPAGSTIPVSAARGSDPAAMRPLAVLQPGAPLVVDLEVTNATVGSEVGVVWIAPDGREAWRQKQTVGDAPRLAFSADTRRWPAGVYRGELHYGRVPVHRFAVQVGRPAVRTTLPGGPAGALRPGAVGGDPPAGSTAAAGAESAIAGLPATAPAAGGTARAAAEPAAPAPPQASPAEAAPAEGQPVENLALEDLPVDEGAPVERIPPDDPNAVAPEGPPGEAPEPPAEPADEDDPADEPPPAAGS